MKFTFAFAITATTAVVAQTAAARNWIETSSPYQKLVEALTCPCRRTSRAPPTSARVRAMDPRRQTDDCKQAALLLRALPVMPKCALSNDPFFV